MTLQITSREIAPCMGTRFDIQLCTDRALSQDREWFDVKLDGEWRRLRLHDYAKIYEAPGLYESLYNVRLRCASPERVVALLKDVLLEEEQSADSLRVLDFGAGNGLVAQELRRLPVEYVAGVDIIEEARDAAMRDRAWCFDDYIVADLLDLPEQEEVRLREARLNTLTCVAALGFGDIPTGAFLKALDLVEAPGWLAFNVKETFFDSVDDDGFGRLVHELTRANVIRLHAYRRYRHRFSCAGEALHYVAVVASKEDDIPVTLLQRD